MQILIGFANWSGSIWSTPIWLNWLSYFDSGNSARGEHFCANSINIFVVFAEMLLVNKFKSGNKTYCNNLFLLYLVLFMIALHISIFVAVSDKLRN